MTNSTTDLYSAIARAQAKAKRVEKDATNAFHRYNYVSAEAMIHEAKQLLAAEGLAVVPVASRLRKADDLVSDDKDWARNARAALVLTCDWVVLHVNGGSMPTGIEWPVAPEKGRPIDKAVAAAHTASLSYLLRDLLQIPRVEEGTELDGDERDEAPPPSQQQRARMAALLSELGIARDGQAAYVETLEPLRALPESQSEYATVIGALESRVKAKRAAAAKQ